VNKNKKGNGLEDLSVDVKIYKIFLVKFRRKIQVWSNRGQLSYTVLTYRNNNIYTAKFVTCVFQLHSETQNIFINHKLWRFLGFWQGLQCLYTFSPYLQFNHLYWHLLTGTADFHLNGKLLSDIANMPVSHFAMKNCVIVTGP